MPSISNEDVCKNAQPLPPFARIWFAQNFIANINSNLSRDGFGCIFARLFWNVFAMKKRSGRTECGRVNESGTLRWAHFKLLHVVCDALNLDEKFNIFRPETNYDHRNGKWFSASATTKCECVPSLLSTHFFFGLISGNSIECRHDLCGLFICAAHFTADSSSIIIDTCN